MEISSSNDDFSKELMCPRCQEQFTDFSEFLTHKIKCENKARKYHESEHSDLEDMVVSEDDDFIDNIAEDEARDNEDEIDGKRIDRVRRYQQDAANNNDNNSYHKEQPLNEDQDNLEVYLIVFLVGLNFILIGWPQSFYLKNGQKTIIYGHFLNLFNFFRFPCMFLSYQNIYFFFGFN